MAAGEKTVRTVKKKANEAVDSEWIDRLVRYGFIVRGVLYLIIGVIAAGVAVGTRSAPKDQTGALQEIAAKPYGQILLLLMATGLTGYALWGVIRAFWNPLGWDNDIKGWLKRLGALASAAGYGVLIVPALQFGMGNGSSQGSGTARTQDMTARILHAPFGPWLVGLAGLIVIGIGISQVYYGYKAGFAKHLRGRGKDRQVRQWDIRLGQIGYAARGIVFALVGLFLVDAALTFDPHKAQGLDGALLQLARQPYGLFLLAVVALGLAAFGIYSLLSAPLQEVT